MRTNNESGKSVILYHRSYRTLPGSIRFFILQFLGMAVPLAGLTIWFYPELTRFMCTLAVAALMPYFSSDTVTIASVVLGNTEGQIHFLDLPGRFPSFLFSLGNLATCLLLILLARLIESKPIKVFLSIIIVVHALSSGFFAAAPALFPYDITDYSYLYAVQQVSVWFFTPLIMGMAILPLPSRLTSKVLTLGVAYIYSVIFGTVRYTVFLFLLAKASLIYMALLFFAFGPLIDLAYIVGIYSFHIAKLTDKAKEDYSLWQW